MRREICLIDCANGFLNSRQQNKREILRISTEKNTSKQTEITIIIGFLANRKNNTRILVEFVENIGIKRSGQSRTRDTDNTKSYLLVRNRRSNFI